MAIGDDWSFTVSDVRPATAAAGCRIYVASGDDVTNGKEMDDNASRYAEQLIADHIKSPGWCLCNQGKNGQTSSSYITGGGMASAYNMRPDFQTITPRRAELDHRQPHHVLLRQGEGPRLRRWGRLRVGRSWATRRLWTNMKNNYTTILLQTSGSWPRSARGWSSPWTNYPNPYPAGGGRHRRDHHSCAYRSSTPSRRAPPDGPSYLRPCSRSTRRSRSSTPTMKNTMAPFQQGPNGSRYVYVDMYPTFEDHCMTMKVADQDQGRAPRGERGSARARLARGQFRLLDDVVRRGLRRNGEAELPAARPRSASSSSGARPPRGWACTRTRTATSASPTRSGTPTPSTRARRR